jgi:predicted dehydrogenase
VTRKVRFGVVGTGNMASTFSRWAATSAEAEVVAAGSRDPETATTYTAEFGVPVVPSDEIASLDVDAIYVAIPTGLHATAAIHALSSGKHVLLEKPMTLTVTDAEEIANAAKSNNRICGLGFHLRHHRIIRDLVDRLEAGAIGDVQYIRAEWGYFAPDPAKYGWRVDPSLAGGGSMMGMGVHLIDLACLLLGRRPSEVTAMNDESQRQIDFVQAMLLKFPPDAIANLVCSRRLLHAPNTLFVSGSTGSFLCTGALGPGVAELRFRSADGDEDVVASVDEVAHARQFEAFAHAVATGADFRANAADGLAAVELTVQAFNAARTTSSELKTASGKREL